MNAAGAWRRRDLRSSRRLAAECLGTGLLVATVVGSGIMGERLAGGNVALALLGNTLPTGAILVVLILALGTDLRRAFQSGRIAGDELAQGTSLAGVPPLRSRANRRRLRRDDGRARHVWAAAA